MKQTQYRLVEKATGKVKGYLVGKTADRGLIIQSGSTRWTLDITPATEKRYRIEAVKLSA